MNNPATPAEIEHKPRSNGKRSFSFIPAEVIAGRLAGHGYLPLSSVQALLALGWIFRQFVRWKPKSKANVYDLMRNGSGCGHSDVPSIEIGPDAAFNYLQGLLARLAKPECHPEFARFARQMLGYRTLQASIRIPVRVPPGTCQFDWLGELEGSRLEISPNKYHDKAVWMHRGILHLNPANGRWGVRISYSYRHDDSSWGIALDQAPGEKLEDFEARAWAWLRDQVQWRHDESFYHRFFGGADGMKRSELKANSRAELEMRKVAADLRSTFGWGKGAPGFWQNDIAQTLLEDTDPQYRTVRRPDMTASRMRTIAKWIRADRQASQKEKARTAA